MEKKRSCVKKDGCVKFESELILTRDTNTKRKAFFVPIKIYKVKMTPYPIRRSLIKCLGTPPKDTNMIKIKEITCYEPTLFYSKNGALHTGEIITVEWEPYYGKTEDNN